MAGLSLMGGPHIPFVVSALWNCCGSLTSLCTSEVQQLELGCVAVESGMPRLLPLQLPLHSPSNIPLIRDFK